VYDADKFKTYNECCICFVEFNADSMITPLPCNIKHYFHTDCIESWLKTKQECPLCRQKVTLEDLEQFSKKVDSLLASEMK